MIDYEQTIQELIKSITNISFEYDFEEVKKEMELQEVPKSELEKLGETKVRENFNKGIYKIQLNDGKIIDANSIQKHIKENNIKEPIIFINPNFNYVQWVIKKDFTTPQIKKEIRKRLTSNSNVDISEVQKLLINEDVKNKKAEAIINELPIKSSSFITEGKFYIQSSTSRESAIKTINTVIEELKVESKKYVDKKIKQHQKYIFIYSIFVISITLLWLFNKKCQTIPIWLTNVIGLILFLIPLVVMRLINHTIFDVLFFRKKTAKKFEKEFYDKV